MIIDVGFGAEDGGFLALHHEDERGAVQNRKFDEVMAVPNDGDAVHVAALGSFERCQKIRKLRCLTPVTLTGPFA